MMNAKELLRQTESLLLQNDHITLAEASATQLHNALSTAAMNALTPTWVKCEAKRQAHRQAYYLSAEYLVGRMVYNNLFCLGLLDDVKALLAEKALTSRFWKTLRTMRSATAVWGVWQLASLIPRLRRTSR